MAKFNGEKIGKGAEYAKIGAELANTLNELIKETSQLLAMLQNEMEKYPLKEEKLNPFENGIFGICDMLVEKQEELVKKDMQEEKEKVSLMIEREDISAVYEDVLNSLRLMPTLRKEIDKELNRNANLATYPNSLKRRTIQARIDLLKSSIECFEMQRQFIVDLYNLEAENAI